MAETPGPNAQAAYAASLRRELAGYETHGNDDRAKQVRAELKRLGAPVEIAVDDSAVTPEDGVEVEAVVDPELETTVGDGGLETADAEPVRGRGRKGQ